MAAHMRVKQAALSCANTISISFGNAHVFVQETMHFDARLLDYVAVVTACNLFSKRTRCSAIAAIAFSAMRFHAAVVSACGANGYIVARLLPSSRRRCVSTRMLFLRFISD
jgi:hypothetical protein